MRPTTSGPSHGMSPAESSTKTRSALGATPGVPVPRPFPAAMSVTCAPWEPGSGSYRSAAYGFAVRSALSMSARSWTRP